MAKVIAYRNDGRASVCKIKFDSREKILVSVAGVPMPSIRVMGLFLGIIPQGTLWEINVPGDAEAAFGKMVAMLGGEGESATEHPLDAVIRKVRPCRSATEAVWALREAAEAAGLAE